jgi:hypothetical protein
VEADFFAAAQTAAPVEARNVVFVHGAWADGSSWSEVIPLLQAAGLRVTSRIVPRTLSARACSRALSTLPAGMAATCSSQQDIDRGPPEKLWTASSRPPTEAASMPTRFWLQQGSAYHFAKTAPDFSIKKLFNVIAPGAFVAYQFIELIFQGFPFAALRITRHMAPPSVPHLGSSPSATQCSGNLGQLRQFRTVPKNGRNAMGGLNTGPTGRSRLHDYALIDRGRIEACRGGGLHGQRC